jgi:hypothetical protein
VFGAGHPDQTVGRGLDSRVSLSPQDPTTASSVSSSFKASPVSSSSGVPVAVGRVNASVLGEVERPEPSVGRGLGSEPDDSVFGVVEL